ncbi:MAG: DNA adenine methylase [Spirochaetota bacterium]
MPEPEQLSLWGPLPARSVDAPIDEAAYRTRQLITCLGNKRALAAPIKEAVVRVRERLGGRRLRVLDAFSGSGVVARHLKAHASRLVANDLEAFAAAASRAFLRNRSTVDEPALRACVAELNHLVATEPLDPGFIAELYAPRDENRITASDRVFYTRENARRLDDYRRRLDGLDSQTRELLLGPLLSQASIRANTAGVFKGFYKDKRTGLGRFGGSGADALSRITGTIELEAPVLSGHECEVAVFQEDANALAGRLPEIDLAYIDPPYNQHPYGSNYFMLNLLVSYERPGEISAVSGIPAGWTRSGYNSRGRASSLLQDLFERVPARFLLVSYNNEGFVSYEEMLAMLERVGRVEPLDIPYTVFRGSRNISSRPVRVIEHLFLVERR